MPQPVLFAVLLALVASPVLAQSSPADSTAALAAKQVETGEQWFRASCRECHVTSLADPDFRLKWGGRSAYDLFESIRSTMPEQSPGSLTLDTYASIVAYLMKANGMPVASALSADSARLSALRLSFAPAATRSSTPR